MLAFLRFNHWRERKRGRGEEERKRGRGEEERKRVERERIGCIVFKLAAVALPIYSNPSLPSHEGTQLVLKR
jgi:hypothetical protein